MHQHLSTMRRVWNRYVPRSIVVKLKRRTRKKRSWRSRWTSKRLRLLYKRVFRCKHNTRSNISLSSSFLLTKILPWISMVLYILHKSIAKKWKLKIPKSKLAKFFLKLDKYGKTLLPKKKKVNSKKKPNSSSVKWSRKTRVILIINRATITKTG